MSICCKCRRKYTTFFDKNLEVLLSKLQMCALKLFERFSNNYMEMNSDKCHLIFNSNDENKKIKNNDEVINKSQVQKLLDELQFDTHIETICEKVRQELLALSRIITFMSTNKEQLLMRCLNSATVVSPGYRNSRNINNQISKLHE